MRQRKVWLIVALPVAVIAFFFAACSSHPPNPAAPTVSGAASAPTARGMFDHSALDKILSIYVNDR